MAEATTLGAVTSDEQKKRASAAIMATIDAKVESAKADFLEGIAAEFAAREVTQRPVFLNSSGEAVTKTYSPTLPLYRHLSIAEREIRNPDSDHWNAEFIRGVRENDRVQMAQARAELDKLFPYLRADTLEGAAAPTTGAFPAGSGGTTIPRPLEQLVAINRDRTAKMWRFATLYNMTTQAHNIPKGDAMTAYMQDEATTPTTTGATFTQVGLVAYNGIAKAIVGNDMLADSAVNLVTYFTQRGGFALGVLEDAEFFKDGTGSAPHVTKLTGTAYAEATTNALAYADVLGMWSLVKQEYRQNARWFVNGTVLQLMAGVKDTQGRPFYQSLLEPPMPIADTPDTSPDRGAVGTLFGRPVHDVPLTSGEIWFGDPAAVYAVGRLEGVTVEVSREFLFDTRRTMFLIRQRFAGQVVDNSTNASQLIAGITSATL